MLSENINQEEFYTIQEVQDEQPTKDDPIAKTFEMIAKTQQEQAKILSTIAEKSNQPVNVYQQPQTQVVENDPIQAIQNEINLTINQLNQLRNNGNIDDDEYYRRYEIDVASKKEQLRDLKFKKELDSTKTELQKSYQQQFEEQKKVIDQIQAQNQFKSEQEKINMITQQFPDATVKDSPLFKEMESILSDPAMNSIFTNPNQNKDQYYALAKMADASLKAKGVYSQERTNTAVNNFGVMGNPSVYQDSGIKTTFTQEHINQLKSEFGASVTNDALIRWSGYNSQANTEKTVTITDWLTRGR